jgi:hypothetical protein
MAREHPDAWGEAIEAIQTGVADQDLHDRHEDADDAQRVRDLWPALMATWQGE